MDKKHLQIIIFLLFLASGFCSLLYQVVWVRLAFAAFGIITPVLSVVISVFMLGLAIGSWFFGKYIQAISRKTGISAIVFYALAEFLIGVSGLAVPELFKLGQILLLPAGEYNSSAYLFFSAVIIGIFLLPWCICMGATVPLMLAFMKKIDPRNTQGFSYLYFANTIGAMCGTLITAVFLVEWLGFKHTLLVAVLINLLIAAVSLILNSIYSKDNRAVPAEEASLNVYPQGAKAANGRQAVLSILFVTGFTSMAMEVAWMRAFTPVLRTTIYSFASILAVYLLATWVGSWIYRKQAEREKVIDTAYLITSLSCFSLLPLILNDPGILRMLFGGNGQARIIAVIFSIFPFCCTLGYLTSKLIDEFSQGDPRAAGKAYALNSVGCILGPLFSGYLLLPVLGIRLAIVVLALPYAAYSAYYLKRLWPKNLKYAFSMVLAIPFIYISCAKFLFSYEDLLLHWGGSLRRDYVATVVSIGKGMDKKLLVNGISMTYLTPVTKFMVHVPLAIRDKNPDSVLIICFGMGTTFRSAASWGIKTVGVELVPSVRDAFGFYFPDAESILKDPDTRVIIDDGRRFLRRTTEKFDVITIDPPPPAEAAGSSLLYSREFYQILKTRLKEAGILQQWFPGGERAILEAVDNSLRAEFPFVRVFNSVEGLGYHFFASLQPFDMPSEKDFLSRLPPAAKADLAEWTPGLGPGQLYSILLHKEIRGRFSLSSGWPMITDDRPFNEYFLLRRLRHKLSL